MKNILLLSLLIARPFYASDMPGETPVFQEGAVLEQQKFEANKAQLPTSLKVFVTDFGTWPKEDKTKISINGLSFIISGLSKERQAPYEGSVGYWIDCRTQTQAQRVAFINCIKYLQK
jgi:hypothetical protein